MYLEQFFIEGLGCASYLVGCEAEGVAAVIDPDRDVSRYLEAAAARGLSITHVIETHLHADHVSGSTDLAARTGATIYIHLAADVGFPHTALEDGDTLQLGNVKVDVLHTPGHTPESISLLITDLTRSSEPWLALTGDTLFVGDVGRPDLVGADEARELAGNLHHSLFDVLSQLDDSLLIYPGHGAGREKEPFVEYMTSNLPEQPGNHKQIKALNRRGPEPLGEIAPQALSLTETMHYLQRGAALLDTRPRQAFAERHIPGSIHLLADDQLSNRVGVVLPPGVPIILLVEDEMAYRRVVLGLARVGYEQVIGYLAEGVAGWEAAGLPAASGDIEDITPQELNAMLGNGIGLILVDVREPWEYRLGHVAEATLIPLGDLASRVDELDSSQPVAVICQSGNRSQSAAALLGQKRSEKTYNVLGGTAAWQSAGFPLARN
jgi:glyoxylase-like metal-dependent hydrolase (beta-lactamase superfamily II)